MDEAKANWACATELDRFAGTPTTKHPAINGFDALFATRVNAEPCGQRWETIRAFRDQPGFGAAVLRYDEISGPFYAHQFILNKVVPEAWRFRMIVFLLHLHDTRVIDDPLSGLTLANFQRVCATLNLASAGRAFAFLNIMRVGGYLVRRRSEHDGRIVHLEPTPRFIDTVERWNDGIFALIDTVVPDAALAAKRARYPGLGREMRRRSAEKLLAGWDPLAAFPEVAHFAARDGGWMLLARAIALTLQGDGTKTVSINLAVFGREFGSSRTQLRRILEDAYRAGLLEAVPQNGANLCLAPHLICAHAAWLASYLSSYYDSAAEGWREWDRTRRLI